MSTAVRVNTYAHSVTYVTDQLLNSLRRIIILAGLNTENLLEEWDVLSRGIRTWLNSKHMKTLVLEVYNPTTGKLVTRWDINIDYTLSPEDDGEFWTDTDALAHSIKKCGVIPSSCKYKVIVSNKDGRPDVDGWSPCEYRSTAGLTRRCVGTTIDAGTVGASTSYWS